MPELRISGLEVCCTNNPIPLVRVSALFQNPTERLTVLVRETLLLFPSVPVMVIAVFPGGVPETVALWLQLVPKANRSIATPRAANRS